MSNGNSDNEIKSWFERRVPADWFSGELDVTTDRDEILVTGALPDPEIPEGAEDDTVELARAETIQQFRAATREERMSIADEAQTLFVRKVSWGAGSADRRVLFTHLGVPVMGRLRLPERRVLDTLVRAGVAKNRSDALSWCVRFVRKDQSDWLDELREAFGAVEKVRADGPRI
jgi:hypothetical protein